MTEAYRKNIHPVIQWVSTFFIINILWFLFRSNSISEWYSSMCHMFSMHSTEISNGLINSFVLPETDLLSWLFHIEWGSKVRGFWMLLFYAFAMLVCLDFENAYKMKYKKNIFTAIFWGLLFVFILTCFSSETVFIYAGF